MAFNWTCPHCDVAQAVVSEKHRVSIERIYLADQSDGFLGIRYIAVGCANAACAKTTVYVAILEMEKRASNWLIVDGGSVFFDDQVYPRGGAKQQPDYIPKVLRDDYIEACLIKDLSPKAAATLVRRCLQGMIRNFAGVEGKTLFAEIDALRKAVDDRSAPETVNHEHIEAIDAVRGIGNIGAHMEKDINVIVDVDPGEAQLLIELVELLFEEWYVARHKRQQRLEQIQQLAAAKRIAIAGQKELRNANAADEAAAKPTE